MPGNGGTVARTIRLFRDAALSPEALSANLAAVARRERTALITSGDASPSYQTIVDGQAGAAEESVRPDGVILYLFNQIGQAAAFALAFCIARSPVESGTFRRSWIVAVDGKNWTGDLNDIPADSEVMVVNPLPYARKIDVGHMRMSVPPGIIESARQAVRRAYPLLDAQRVFVNLPPGAAQIPNRFGPVPYVLHGRARSRRKDRQAGSVMTYPALIISQRA